MDNNNEQQTLHKHEAPPAPAQDSTRRTGEGKKKKSAKKTVLVIVIAVFLVLVLLFSVALVYLQLWRSGRWQPSSEVKDMLKSAVKSTELMDKAKAIKADMGALAEGVFGQDIARAEAARDNLQQDIGRLKKYLSSPMWEAVSKTPVLKSEAKTVHELVDILEEADEKIIGPYIELQHTRPLTDLKAEDGIQVQTLLAYMDFLEQIMPDAEALYTRFRVLDLHMYDENGQISEYSEKIARMLDAGLNTRDALPALRVLLGNGNDRLYIFAAQNSSEIRASGGFPGSVGMIRIRDGVLRITDFQSVYNVFSASTPSRAQVTTVENRIFSGRLNTSWDSDFSPDFERVAYIWALAYQDHNGEAVDGVISGTPVIIQRLLSFLGSIQLSDGTELNGENATRVLGHDLYFKYLGINHSWRDTVYVDELFSESARETLNLLVSRMDVNLLADYFAFFHESIADRTLMIWMADENEQALMREAGWTAGLGHDPARPQAGIFFNSTYASKMAWFLNIDPELSDPVENADGSKSYELTVKLSNVMTDEERRQASQYILGNTSGITGSIYIFAPAGGTVDQLEASNGRTVKTETYEGLDLGYMIDVTIESSSPLVVRCVLTTAPGAEEPLTLIVTPTLQEYR